MSRFFFAAYAALRDLHSFPTRRSSDLRRDLRRPRPEGWGPARGRRAPPPRGGLIGVELLTEPFEAEFVRTGAIRSEEHTSELQSLAYLVCRLLLEKKKKSKLATRHRHS